MGSLTYDVNSSKNGVTEQNVKNATNNLYKNSKSFRQIIDTIFANPSQPDIKIIVNDTYPESRVHTPHVRRQGILDTGHKNIRCASGSLVSF